jgi:hypothetical protein
MPDGRLSAERMNAGEVAAGVVVEWPEAEPNCVTVRLDAGPSLEIHRSAMAED